MSTDPNVQKLDQLRQAGVLTDQEYQDARNRVVSQGASPAQAVAAVTGQDEQTAQQAIDHHTGPTSAAPTRPDTPPSVEEQREQQLADAAAAGHNAEPSEVYDPAAAHQAGAPLGYEPEGGQ